MKNFNGKLALITGGSSGIGLSLACELFSEGMSVAILARGQQRLEEAVGLIEKSRVHQAQKIAAVAADVANAAEIQQVLADLKKVLAYRIYSSTAPGSLNPAMPNFCLWKISAG